MKMLSTDLACPSCEHPMQVSALHCASCDVTVSGSFAMNEFAKLNADELHFLRMFLMSEGRIREMEGPLGLSYPTIRTRLGQMKAKLFGTTDLPSEQTSAPRETVKTPHSAPDTLAQLERGEIDFEEALRDLENQKANRKSKKPTGSKK